MNRSRTSCYGYNSPMQISYETLAQSYSAPTLDFLRACARGKVRKGKGTRLRKIVAKNEVALFGTLACYCCGRPLSLASSTLEHIVPQSLGGKNILENLALSHAACNQARGNTPSLRAPLAVSEIHH